MPHPSLVVHPSLCHTHSSTLGARAAPSATHTSCQSMRGSGTRSACRTPCAPPPPAGRGQDTDTGTCVTGLSMTWRCHTCMHACFTGPLGSHFRRSNIQKSGRAAAMRWEKNILHRGQRPPGERAPACHGVTWRRCHVANAPCPLVPTRICSRSPTCGRRGYTNVSLLPRANWPAVACTMAVPAGRERLAGPGMAGRCISDQRV